MNKKYKLSLILIFITCLLIFSFNIIIKATPIGIINYINEVESVQLDNSVTYQKRIINSYYNTNSPRDNNVYTYTIKNNSSDVKLATWTYKSQNGYTNKNLMDIAKDYELNHPGYIVLGGINTEGYVASNDPNSVYELTNAFIQDGDVIRKDISLEETKEMIALNYNGTHVIKRMPEMSNNPYLYIYNSNNYNKSEVNYHLEIKHINELPTSNEISILTPALNQTLNLSNYTVIECYYDMYRRTTNFPGGCLSGNNYGIFLKGMVTNNQVNLNEISSVNLTKFYLVSKDSSLKDKLNNNTYIKCQYDYLDEFGQVESAVGYWFKYMENGVICDENYKVYLNEENRYSSAYGSHDYWKSVYKERAGIGFKENGDVVILASNYQVNGPTQYEIGMYFKEMGCVDAYQFDGGGSVTFIKRTETGEFEMLNQAADGVPRTILSGLFIVKKVPEIQVEMTNKNESSVNLSLNFKDLSTYDYDKIYIKLDDSELIDITNLSVNLTNIQRNKYYNYHIYFEKDNNIIDTYCAGKVRSSLLKATFGTINVSTNNNVITYKLNIDDIDNTISKIYIKIGDSNFKLVNNNEYIINTSNLDILDITIRYTYTNGLSTEDVLLLSNDNTLSIDYNASTLLESIFKYTNNLIDDLLK